MKSTVLVAGGAGFLGSHLCDRLLADGNDVICVDNLFTGREDNIRHLYSNSHFKFILHDVTEPLIIPCDKIYSMACPASPIQYQKDPIFTARTCFLGTLNLLELARQNKARILLTSTSEVYGNPLMSPQPETYLGNVNPNGVRACYDEGKRIAETLFSDYHRQYGVSIKIVRIFNTYGPRMSETDGRVISNFVYQALRGKNITIYGDGCQTRSFCYVDDMIEGFVRMMESSVDFIGPVNLGNPYEITIKEIAELIKHLTKTDSKIVYCTAPIDDPQCRNPDISLAYYSIGWEPMVSLKEGLIRTIQYIRNSNL